MERPGACAPGRKEIRGRSVIARRPAKRPLRLYSEGGDAVFCAREAPGAISARRADRPDHLLRDGLRHEVARERHTTSLGASAWITPWSEMPLPQRPACAVPPAIRTASARGLKRSEDAAVRDGIAGRSAAFAASVTNPTGVGSGPIQVRLAVGKSVDLVRMSASLV